MGAWPASKVEARLNLNLEFFPAEYRRGARELTRYDRQDDDCHMRGVTQRSWARPHVDQRMLRIAKRPREKIPTHSDTLTD